MITERVNTKGLRCDEEDTVKTRDQSNRKRNPSGSRQISIVQENKAMIHDTRKRKHVAGSLYSGVKSNWQ